MLNDFSINWKQIELKWFSSLLMIEMLSNPITTVSIDLIPVLTKWSVFKCLLSSILSTFWGIWLLKESILPIISIWMQISFLLVQFNESTQFKRISINLFDKQISLHSSMITMLSSFPSSNSLHSIDPLVLMILVLNEWSLRFLNPLLRFFNACRIINVKWQMPIWQLMWWRGRIVMNRESLMMIGGDLIRQFRFFVVFHLIRWNHMWWWNDHWILLSMIQSSSIMDSTKWNSLWNWDNQVESKRWFDCRFLISCSNRCFWIWCTSQRVVLKWNG